MKGTNIKKEGNDNKEDKEQIGNKKSQRSKWHRNVPTPPNYGICTTKTTNFKGILREIKSTTDILGRTGQRDTFRQVRRGQEGDTKGLGPKNGGI